MRGYATQSLVPSSVIRNICDALRDFSGQLTDVRSLLETACESIMIKSRRYRVQNPVTPNRPTESVSQAVEFDSTKLPRGIAWYYSDRRRTGMCYFPQSYFSRCSNTWSRRSLSANTATGYNPTQRTFAPQLLDPFIAVSGLGRVSRCRCDDPPPVTARIRRCPTGRRTVRRRRHR